MSYEVDRDVKIEIVDESDGRMHEAAYGVAGLGRCATRMPAYTDEELRLGLGEAYDEIENTFANLD